MENNEDLKKIKLFMNYDSRKTLKENEEKIGLLLEGVGTVKDPYTSANLQSDVDTVVDDIDGYVAEYNVKSIYSILTKYKDKWGLDTSNPDKPKTVSAIKLFADLYEMDEGEKLKDDLESIGTMTFSNTAIQQLKDCIYYVKTYYSKAVPETTTTTTTKKVVGGGGTGVGDDKIVTTASGGETNMARNSKLYWRALYDALTAAGFNVRTGGKEIDDATEFTVGKFTIDRDYDPLVCYDCSPWVDSKSSGYTRGDLAATNATPYRYSGELDLNKVKLLVKNAGDKDYMNLIDFLSLDRSKTNVKDNTGGGRTSGGGGRSNTGGGGTSGGGGRSNTGGGGTYGWKSCTGTYSYGCKSSEVGEAQRCMGISVDDKFGNQTLRALKNKFGKTSFTDDYLKNTICKTKGGGGDNSGYDFDKEDGGSSDGGSSDGGSSTFTGTVY